MGRACAFGHFAANEEYLSPLHSQEIQSVGGGGGKRQATHGHFVMCLSWVARRLLIQSFNAN